jgi:Domain of unknown function (DUF5666)
MNKTWFIGAALVLALFVPAAARAHEGHAHKVLGTVSAIDGDHVTLKTTAGKSVVVMLDAKTTIARGTAKLDRTALKIGERVSVDYEEAKGMFMAQAIKLGAVPAVATTKK